METEEERKIRAVTDRITNRVGCGCLGMIAFPFLIFPLSNVGEAAGDYAASHPFTALMAAFLLAITVMIYLQNRSHRK
jgi:hypothetical protein